MQLKDEDGDQPIHVAAEQGYHKYMQSLYYYSCLSVCQSFSKIRIVSGNDFKAQEALSLAIAAL